MKLRTHWGEDVLSLAVGAVTYYGTGNPMHPVIVFDWLMSRHPCDNASYWSDVRFDYAEARAT